MSFSFYEPWVNTAHVNDILTQSPMNNAFKFTFMLELDPSQHPFAPYPSLISSPLGSPPLPLSPQRSVPTPYPSLPHPPPPLPLPYFTIHPHECSTSFILPCPSLFFSPSSYTSIRWQKGSDTGWDLSFQNWRSTKSVLFIWFSLSGRLNVTFLYS